MNALYIIMAIVGVMGGLVSLAGAVVCLTDRDDRMGLSVLASLACVVLAAGFGFMAYFGTVLYDQREQDACNKAAHGHGRIVGFQHGKYTEDHCFVQAPDGGWELLY